MPIIRSIVPPFPLSQFVACLWIHADYRGPQPRERVLPTGTMNLVFSMDGRGRVASSVAGARTDFLEIDTSGPFSAIGVQFRAGGSAPFFALPADELKNRIVPLHLLWGTFATRLVERVWEANHPDAQFGILADALLRQGRSRLAPQPAIRYAVDQIERSQGSRPVRALADELGISERRFLDTFRSQVGLSPKEFARTRRFAMVLQLIERVPDANLVDVALSCGYFDQAHFNHDFRAFAGVSPSTYLRQHISRTHVCLTPK